MKKVEQINKDGTVTLAKDEILNINSEIKGILSKHLKILNDKNPFEVFFKGKRFYLCVKNVSYLGHPHPLHKKRIQIPGAWQEILKDQGN